MKTIRTTIEVDAEHRATIQLPEDVAPGTHHAVVVVDDRAFEPLGGQLLADFPVIDVGPWPKGLSGRREDLYGDEGR